MRGFKVPNRCKEFGSSQKTYKRRTTMKLRQAISPNYGLGLSAEATDNPDGMSNMETIDRTVYSSSKAQ